MAYRPSSITTPAVDRFEIDPILIDRVIAGPDAEFQVGGAVAPILMM